MAFDFFNMTDKALNDWKESNQKSIERAMSENTAINAELKRRQWRPSVGSHFRTSDGSGIYFCHYKTDATIHATSLNGARRVFEIHLTNRRFIKVEMREIEEVGEPE
jgi:hypothetical protein